MQPFAKILAERYRLALAIFMLPLTLVVWILMAETGKLLSILFRGRVFFSGYLNLFALCFFTFWFLGAVLDMVRLGLLGDYVLIALQREYGEFFSAFAAVFPALMWTAMLALGGIYNGIVARESEGYTLGKAVLVGAMTYFLADGLDFRLDTI